MFDEAVRTSSESCISICIRSGRLCFTVPARKDSPVGRFPLCLMTGQSNHWLRTDNCNNDCLSSSALQNSPVGDLPLVIRSPSSHRLQQQAAFSMHDTGRTVATLTVSKILQAEPGRGGGEFCALLLCKLSCGTAEQVIVTFLLALTT